jgi:hypothetical protein
MNDKEKTTADALLDKLAKAAPEDVVQFAQAYQALTQGATNRTNAERNSK